jgi:poly(A) polymerase
MVGRKQVLQTMQQVTMKFVRHVGQLKGLPPNVIDNAGGKIFTFGSYRLGVFGPGRWLEDALRGCI